MPPASLPYPLPCLLAHDLSVADGSSLLAAIALTYGRGMAVLSLSTRYVAIAMLALLCFAPGNHCRIAVLPQSILVRTFSLERLGVVRGDRYLHTRHGATSVQVRTGTHSSQPIAYIAHSVWFHE